MSNVINFRQARKAKARVEKARQADVNRVKFGRTKVEKMADAEENRRNDKMIDDAKLDKGSDFPASPDD